MRLIDADALLEKAYIPNTKILNGWWHKETLEDVRNAPTIEPKKVVYLCDGRACDGTCNECNHTSDVTHARNFERRVDAFYEKIIEPKQVTGKLQASYEPKRGRWIMQRVGEHDEYCVCSECGNQTESDEAWNYCPNCGARMGARYE